MPVTAVGHAGEERVERLQRQEPSILDGTCCVLTVNAVTTMRCWYERGDKIVYLRSQ